MAADVNWRHVAPRFRHFVEALPPTAGEHRRALDLAGRVDRMLRRRFPVAADGGTAPGGDAMIIGGYGKNTAIRALSAVDLLFILPERCRTGTGTDASRGRTTWAPILRDMAGLLTARFTAVEMSKDGWLTVTCRGQDDVRAAVRVIPGFAGGSGCYLIAQNAARTPGAPWRPIDPAAEMLRLSAADDLTGGKARHLVRMLKAWRVAAAVPIAPFALEMLACEFLAVWIYRWRSLLFYDWMIRDFYFWLTAQAGRTLVLPETGDRLDLGERWLARAWTAYALADEAANLERDNQVVPALARWRQIFGGAFADPETATLPARPPRPPAARAAD